MNFKVRFWTILPIVPTTVEGSPLYHEYETTFSDRIDAGGMGGAMELLFCEVFQLVFQPKYKTHINHNNQSYKRSIQITPAHQSENDKARQVRALSHLGFGNRWFTHPPVGAGSFALSMLNGS
jgi:hypothetical protein